MIKKVKIAFQVKEENLSKKLKNDIVVENFKFIFEDQIEPKDADFILMDTLCLEEESKLSLLKNYGQKTILISDKKDEDNIKLYLTKYPINHLVGFNSRTILKEVHDAILKKLTDPFWGIDRYLDVNFLSQACKITNNHDIETLAYKVIEQFNFSNTFEASIDYLKLIANELINNAFFNTINPESERSNQNITLSDENKIIFTMGKDEQYIIFSILDEYGLLTRKKAIECISRSFQEKTPQNKKGGAGLGLYLTFFHSNQLIINRERDKRTEVIIIIDCNKRYKKYKERITSLHFHEVGK